MLAPRMTLFSSPGGTLVPGLRDLGRETLSLALIDARNHTLSLLGAHEEARVTRASGVDASDPSQPPPIWMAGHLAWFAEWWIGRNPQRALGARSPFEGVRLASVLAHADQWFHPRGDRWNQALPDPQVVRGFMLDQLEGTLELLDKAIASDNELFMYRAALFHEEARSEHFLVQAQGLGLDWGAAVQRPSAAPALPALIVPATRWTPGWPSEGFALPHEKMRETFDVPEFEIDAQPVCWAQYLEFVDDGGYDRPELWHPDGWRWVEASGRRAPRHVEQIAMSGGAAVQSFFGKPARLSGHQPVMHVTWWEADAWTRWAGRRLPTEVEWEVASHAGARRGFQWGDVHEWTAGTLRPAPGFQAEPWASETFLDPQPFWGLARVRRGASFVTPPRLRDPRSRRFALPASDDDFVGFRSCAI